MGQDIEWKSYFSNDGRYADIINGIVFQGKQIVAETDLHEIDTQTGFLHVVSHYANAAELLGVKENYGKEGKVDMCKAIRDLMEDSRAEGREEGADRINQLIILLSEQGRMDDIVRAAKDRKYQEKLFREELGIR